MKELNLEPLENAVAQLEKGLDHFDQSPHDELLRDGVIQRFEYTVDLSWKLLQRYLLHLAQVDVETMRTKKDLFREGARLKLIDDAAAWIAHYEARNTTAHTYGAQAAQSVLARARTLVADTNALLKSLRDATSD